MLSGKEAAEIYHCIRLFYELKGGEFVVLGIHVGHIYLLIITLIKVWVLDLSVKLERQSGYMEFFRYQDTNEYVYV